MLVRQHECFNAQAPGVLELVRSTGAGVLPSHPGGAWDPIKLNLAFLGISSNVKDPS